MDPELDGQAARQRHGEDRQDHETPGFITHVEAEGGHQRAKQGEERHSPDPPPNGSAWVTLCHQEDGEDDGDEVLLLVRLDDEEPQQEQEGRDGCAALDV